MRAVLTQTELDRLDLQHPRQDIAHNPVALAFAILPANGKPTLFIDGRKLSNSVRAALADLAEIREPAEFAGGLAALGFAEAQVLLDPQTAAAAIAGAIREPGGTIVEGADPVAAAQGAQEPGRDRRRARGRICATARRWSASSPGSTRTAPSGSLDEVAAADSSRDFRAERARRDGSELVDLSFDTISGAGPNGAIVHYRATPETSRRLETGTLYLVDSGGQYPRRHDRHHPYRRHRHAH